MAGTLLVAGNPRRKKRKKRSTRKRYRRNPVPYSALMAGNPRRLRDTNIFGMIINDAVPASIGALAAKSLYNLTALRGGGLMFARLGLGIAAPLAIAPIIGRSRAKYFGLGAVVMAVLPYLSQLVEQFIPTTTVATTPTIMGDVPMSELGDVPRSELGQNGIEILDGQVDDFELLEGYQEPFGTSEPFGNAGHGANMAARFSGG